MNAMTNLLNHLGRRFVISVPYIWLLVFFALPFLILLRISITDMGDSIDPFTPLLNTTGERWRWFIHFKNYLPLLSDGTSS